MKRMGACAVLAVALVMSMLELVAPTAGASPAPAAPDPATTLAQTAASSDQQVAGPTVEPEPSPPSAPSAVQPCAGTLVAGQVRGCTIGAAGEIDTFSITTAAFDHIAVRAGSPINAFTPQVEVKQGATSVCSWSGDAAVQCTLSAATAYTIQVQASGGTGTGAYNVTFESLTAPSACSSLASTGFDAAPHAGGWADAGKIDCVALPNAAGETIEQVLSASVADTIRTSIVNASGQSVCDWQVYQVGYMNPCVLNGSAPFRAFVSTSSIQVGTYSTRVLRLDATAGCSPLTLSTYGTATGISGSIASAGEVDCYSFTGSAFATESIKAVVTAGSFTPRWRVVSSTGSVICSNVTNDAQLCDLLAAGSYKLLVSADDATRTGTYEASVYSVTAGTGCVAVPSTAFDQTPMTGSIAAVSQIDCYQLTASAGDRFRFDIAPSAPNATMAAKIVNAAGDQLCGFSGYRADCTLTGSAPFRVLVYGNNSDLGGYELRAFRFNAPQGCSTMTMTPYGASPTSAGSLDSPREEDCYTFTAPAFGVILARAVVTAGNLSPSWEVHGPNGDVVCSSNNQSPASCPLGGAGTYSLVVASPYYSPTDIGTYTTSIWDAKGSTGCAAIPSLAFGSAPVTASIDVAGELDCHSFTGSASQVVRFQMVTTTPGTGFEGGVYNAAGQQVCSVNWMSDCTLSGSGPYKVLVGGQSATTGSYELRANRLSGPAGCSALNPSAFGTAPSVQRSIDAPREEDCYTFTGGTFGGNELFHAAVTGGSMNGRWELFSAAGANLCAGGDDSPGVCQLPINGTYTVVVSSTNDQAGSYTLGWYDVRSPSAACGDLGPLAFGEGPRNGTVSAVGEIDCDRFDAAASDVIRTRLTSLSSGTSFRGVALDGAGNVVCSYSEQSTCSLSGTAPFRFLTWSVDQGTGSYELRAWTLNDPGGCTTVRSAAFGFGPVEQSLVDPREADCFLFAGAVGDQFSVKIENLDLPQSTPYLEMLDPGGNVICSAWSGTLDQCTLTATGTYALIAGSYYNTAIYGRYRIEGTCLNPACGTEEYAIASMAPTSAGAGSSVTVDLRGRVLSLGDKVRLERSGSQPINGSSVAVSEDRRALSVTFNLAGAAAGLWNVVVTPATGSANVTLTNAFSVVAPSKPEVKVQIVGTERFVPGRPQTMTVAYQNKGNVDALGVPIVVYGFPASATVEPLFSLQRWDVATHTNVPTAFDPATMVAPYGAGLATLPLVVGRVPAGGKGEISFRITVPTQTNYRLSIKALQCFNANGFAGGAPVVGEAPGPIGCAAALAGETSALASLAGFVPGGPCVGLAAGVAQQVMFDSAQGSIPYSNTSLIGGLSTGLSAAACVASVIPGGQVVSGVLGIAGDLLGLADSVNSGMNDCGPPDESGLDRNWVTSMDPNEISGPIGGGPNHAIADTQSLTYSISFENMATAGAPAQEVSIVDHLDPAVFDLSTLQLGRVQWGTDSFTPTSGDTEIDTVVDLRPGKNLKLQIKGVISAGGDVTWTMKSLDPVTNDLPEDPSLGFLPPNTNGTEGQGLVRFSVGLKNPANGATVTNKASITFDLNAPIVTNTWSNLVDKDKPTSKVATLPATTAGTDIAVSWSGSDATSGIDSYDVFVSVDGGSYEAWKQATTDTSGTYAGVSGKSYAFSSVARDLAGNTELLPPTPDATTTLGPPITGSYFHPLAPTRILDSRGSNGGWNAKLAAGAPKTLTVTGGANSIPSSAVAVVMNVTVTGGTANSFLTAYPAGDSPPTASNVNFAAGETIPNLVTVKVGTNGQVAFANNTGSVDVIADIVGYYDASTGDRYNPLPPARILDSRGANGGWNAKLTAGAAKVLAVRGAGGVPATADAVILNVTATDGTANSFITAYPSGGAVPTASNVNFAAGQTIPNLVTVKLGADGKVAFANNSGSVHVIVDVVGYYDTSTGDVFHPLTPNRILDSRGPNGGWNAKLTAPTAKDLQVTGAGGVPAGATAVIGNTTVTGGTANSFVTVYPSGGSVPTASNVNFAAGQTIPNLTAVKVGAGGKIAFNNANGATHVIFDVVGYFATT